MSEHLHDETAHHADAPEPGFVRLAMADEAGRIAELQAGAWARAGLGDQLPGHAVVSATWLSAITAPPLASYRVLVATAEDHRTVLGFAAIGPSEDPDAEPTDAVVGEFVVGRTGRGHGSRLLNAVVDTMRADGFERATWWVPTTDDGLRAFLTGCGWAPDGAHREIGPEDGSVSLRQVRLHTAL
ncbi:GNAT family N-acetyltransferase [Propionibacterium australiense]|uniref:Acetyltransferase (GNAT) family n=2 Tax=Propionibacterium australiense TaxID=119981 RepID=A0A383S9L2_9ACTN|nr:GNAT family N-acetyltransferase [Propionibacterium australiense]SYZ34059.1 Acetyltransferase (GNAT) family [Propionibacterium australiense]VEH92113.1 Acetyltransferase (GNAT) family [Propionibacterium australiense]